MQINVMMKNKKISYSAIVLDKLSKDKVLSLFGSEIPEGWEIICHHITINLGPLQQNFGYIAGDVVSSKIISLGISNKAVAVEVDAKTMNKHSHITIAIDRNGGAFPKDSNNIENWYPVEGNLIVSGIVEELEN